MPPCSRVSYPDLIFVFNHLWAEKAGKLVRIMHKLRAYCLSGSVRICHMSKEHGCQHLFWLFKRFGLMFLALFQRVWVVKEVICYCVTQKSLIGIFFPFPLFQRREFGSY